MLFSCYTLAEEEYLEYYPSSFVCLGSNLLISKLSIEITFYINFRFVCNVLAAAAAAAIFFHGPAVTLQQSLEVS